ncbi:hypothetical protein BT67DRAFT_18835 [Trichocladium antarcticum]|uniref:Uncharacterized protein n=1 Tax=Trichocladium antarcticum TaxID=1450529 RepID=A0AAN6UU63_9PEZI|nr:hypothetical protein BT67DRAFT_18835 [Trichocladium antarcticum]
MRFWMRRRSSGSVTSVQSSVLGVDLDEDLSFLEMEMEEEEERRWEIRDEDISCSMSEPDWVAVLLSLRLALRSFFGRVVGGARCSPCLVVLPEPSQSSCWACMYSWSSGSWYRDISKETGVDVAHKPKDAVLLLVGS